MRSLVLLTIIVITNGVLLAACNTGAGQSAPTEKQASQSASPAQSQTPATQSQTKVNLNEIFPPGPGRELVLENCTNCHTITPIVLIQMDRPARERWARDHRERVYAMSDADFKTMTEYLVEHFSPGKPVPKLPKELLDTWTSY